MPKVRVNGAELYHTDTGGPGTPVPDIPSWSARDYGNRVGVFRLMEVLERHGIRATVALNSELCAEHPEIIAEGNKLKWEWMGHCESNTRRLNAAAPGEEVGGPALKYINRLSDFLFVAARYVNHKGKADVLWVPGQNR